MLGLAAIPSAVQFVAFLMMPESPRWLVIQNRHKEAHEILAKLRGTSTDISQEYEHIRCSIRSAIDDMEHRGDDSRGPKQTVTSAAHHCVT